MDKKEVNLIMQGLLNRWTLQLDLETFSVRACARTRARAAIFVHSGAGGALKVCVRVRAYTIFLVRT